MTKLIIDSGATKTDWCLLAPDGTAQRFATPGMNLSTIGVAENRAVLEEALGRISEVSEIHFYAAGLLGETAQEAIDAVLRTRFPAADIEYASDLLAAARAVCGHAPGIAAIIGTGSNTCLYDGHQIVKNVHGGGFIIGDEGSAAALGREFLADFIKDLVPEDIAADFAARFESDYAAIVRNVYRSATPSRYLGSIAPFLCERAAKPYVKSLIENNFRNFFERALLQYDRLPVGVVGGFGAACRPLLEQLGEGYGITFSRFVKSPMEGLVDYHGL